MGLLRGNLPTFVLHNHHDPISNLHQGSDEPIKH